VKLLIIAGPYEADRIRRAAVAAHFETVAVEPGESLSGWISASRPDAIVMAPRMVNADPAVALAKVRSVPRGRVPIFLVGDADDEERLSGLADGFFVRPISPEDLIEQARARLARDGGVVVVAGSEGRGSGPVSAGEAPGSAVSAVSAVVGETKSAAGGETNPSGDFVKPTPTPTPKSGPHSAKTLGALKPLVASGESPRASAAASVRASAPGDGAFDLLVQLGQSIDETLDAEIEDVVRELAAQPERAPDGDDDDAAAVEELRDESSQKTVEVPASVVAKMMAGGPSTDTGVHAGTPVAPPGNEPRSRARASRRAGGASSSATARIEIVPAPSESGALGSPDIAALLGRIFAEGLTGMLTLRRGEAEKAIAFLHGAPITARSNLPEDRMGEMLVRQGRVSPRQREDGVRSAASKGRRLGAMLVEMGVLKASELAPLVRRHFEEIVYSLFAWTKGGASGGAGGDDWTLGPDMPDTAEDIGMVEAPPALIMEGIRRKHTPSRLLDGLGGEGQVLRLREGIGTSRILEKMALTEPERAIVALFDGARSLGEIRGLSDLPAAAVYGVAWALVTLGRLAPAGAAAADSEPPVQPAPAAGDGGDAGRDRAIDRARVLARYELVREGDYFQLLGLPRDAGSHEVLRAHQVLARELSAQALDGEVVAQLGAELRAIHAVLDEGARVLGDPRMRHRYLAHLASPPSSSPPPAGSPAGSAAPPARVSE
jgi:CheY-like chemotaxis protein